MRKEFGSKLNVKGEQNMIGSKSEPREVISAKWIWKVKLKWKETLTKNEMTDGTANLNIGWYVSMTDTERKEQQYISKIDWFIFFNVHQLFVGYLKSTNILDCKNSLLVSESCINNLLRIIMIFSRYKLYYLTHRRGEEVDSYNVREYNESNWN